jgi:adenylate kinase
MKNNIKRDYHSKTQNKGDSRLNKYVEKTKLKHNDEIVKVNQERLRKLEREHIRNDHVAPAIDAF